MAEKRRFLDVWIIESNTVYREVPFEVVTDWVQQGRLLADDMLRWSGKADWFKLGSTPLFAAYLPRSEPYAVEDRSEALEPAIVDFRWKQRDDDDEGDIDMIPLIDVSLVLLIFFMMTTTGVIAASNIDTPPAYWSWQSSNPEMIWVGIDVGADSQPRYSIGKGERPVEQGDDNLTRDQVLARLDGLLKEAGSADVNIRADKQLKSGVVRDLATRLEERGARIPRKFIGVSEPK